MLAAAALLALALVGDAEVQIAPRGGADRPAAGPRAWVGDVVERVGAVCEAEPDSPGEEIRPSAGRAPLQVSIEGGGGARGDASLQLLVQWHGEVASLGLGVEGVAGNRITPRQGLVVQAETMLAPLALHGEVRVRPAQVGGSRWAAELGTRLEGAAGSVDLSLRAVSARAAIAARSPPTVQAGGAQFSSFGGAVEVEAPLAEALAVGLRLSGAANRLRVRGQRPQQPWDAFGAALQEWPDRWEALVSLRGNAGRGALTLSAGAGAPAASGVLAARGSLRAELETGPATWAVAVAVSHQWPALLWLAELTLGASFRFGGL
ncbi:MAG: hypothetical protein NVS4B10_09690 [Myxococcales bacterium]